MVSSVLDDTNLVGVYDKMCILGDRNAPYFEL